MGKYRSGMANKEMTNKFISHQGIQYSVSDLLGEGHFNNVYRVFSSYDGKEYALKSPKKPFYSMYDLGLYKKEVYNSSLFKSRYVFKILDYSFQSPPFLISEIYNQGSLKDAIYLNDVFLTLSSKIQFLKELCYMGKDLNEKVVHRHLKPENIMLSSDKKPIAIDLAQARTLNEKTPITISDIGTRKYLAPEAWDFQNNQLTLDIYSLGIIFYEILWEAYPFTTQPTFLKQNYKKEGEFVFPTLESTQEKQVLSIILDMLNKNYKKRPSNYEEIIDKLQNIEF